MDGGREKNENATSLSRLSLSVLHSLSSLIRPVTLLRLQATAKWISGAADLISDGTTI